MRGLAPVFCHVSFHRKPHGGHPNRPLPDSMLDTSTWITLQQDTTKQEKAMGEETSTKLRSSVRAKENGRDRGGTSPSTGSPAPHTPSSSTSGPSSHATLAYVFLFLLVDLLGFTVILPLIPSLLEYYDKHDEVGFNELLLTCTTHENTLRAAPQ